MGALVNFDRAAFLAVNHGLNCRALDWLMPHVTDLGLGVVQTVLIICLALIRGLHSGELRQVGVWRVIQSRRAWVIPVLLAFAIGGTCSILIKQVLERAHVERERPWWFYVREVESGRARKLAAWRGPRAPLKVDGFPSGHTTTSAAIAMTVTLLPIPRRRRAIVAGFWALALFIGVSRIYIADHWPLDVLGGLILGAISGWVACVICRQRGVITLERSDA